jgi:hypothetical protein
MAAASRQNQGVCTSLRRLFAKIRGTAARALSWNTSQAQDCAKLCHSGGGELEQIQFLLGHACLFCLLSE